jgi:hypothetical protein
VGGVHALVAENAADLEHLLDTADHQPLEMQLQRDPQVDVHVVGVDVADEWARVGPAVHRLQHRRLHLEEAAGVQFLPYRPDNGALELRHPPCFRVDDQIYITLTDPRLDVRQSSVLLGKGPQALGCNGERVRQNREFPAAGGDDLALHANVVPDVHVMLPRRQRLGTHAVL